MKQTELSLFVILVASSFFYSCEKLEVNSSDCTAGCKTIHLSGKLVDVSSNEGIKNTEVKAHFYQWKSNCFFCFGEPVETFGKTTTDDQGRFKIAIVVDTGVFIAGYHYALDVYANANDNYILGNQVSFNDYHENFQNITLTKYKKTRLSIKFKRDSADVFYSYVVSHSFFDSINNVSINLTNQNPIFVKAYGSNISDSTVDIYTGANFYAKIISKKFSATSTISTLTDSILCNANTNNNISISY